MHCNPPLIMKAYRKVVFLQIVYMYKHTNKRTNTEESDLKTF